MLFLRFCNVLKRGSFFKSPVYTEHKNNNTSITSSGFQKFWTPPESSRSSQVLTLHPPLNWWCNTWTEGKLLDDFSDRFQIIKIWFNISKRNIFWGVGAVFKDIKPWFMKKFISLLIISSILQQYLLSVSTLPPLTFKVSAHHHHQCHYLCLDPPPLPNLMT